MKQKLATIGGAIAGGLVGGPIGALIGGAVAALATNSDDDGPAHVFLVDGLSADENGPLLVRSDGSSESAHFRQGQLDGACGVYAVVMGLHLVGAMKDPVNTLVFRDHDGRTPDGKFVKRLRELGEPLFRDGSKESDWVQLVGGYSRLLHYDAKKWGGAKARDWVLNYVNVDEEEGGPSPVVMSIQGKNGLNHAVLAVGVSWAEELDEEDEYVRPSKLLILDPGANPVPHRAWTSEIDLVPAGGGRYRYTYRDLHEEGDRKVSIHAGLAMWTKHV